MSQVGRRGTEEGRGHLRRQIHGPGVGRLISDPTQDGQGLRTSGAEGPGSPWHQADQLHRDDPLHRGNLWGQRGQESHVHQRDPGWGSQRDNQGLKSGLLYHGPASYSSRWGRVGCSEGHWWQGEGQGEAQCEESPQPRSGA